MASKFKKIISLNKKNFNGKKKNLSFFFGSDCMHSGFRRGNKIIHFPDDKIDIFSSKISSRLK